MTRSRQAHTAALTALALLTTANLLNNRYARRACVPVSLTTAALLALTAHRAGHRPSALGLDPAAAPRGLRYGGTAAAAVGAVYTAGALLPATRPLFADQRAAPTLPGMLRQALVDVPLGTVVLEEVAFRGVLPALLREAYGPRAGEVLPVVLFGLWHLLPAADLATANPALATATTPGSAPAGPSRAEGAVSAVLTTAAGGVVFAALRRRTGSLLAPALLHTAFNSLGYAAAWAVTRRR